jgi:excisionase family DNA binding protein
MKPAQVARLLKISKVTVHKYINLGYIKSMKLTRDHRIADSEIKRFLDCYPTGFISDQNFLTIKEVSSLLQVGKLAIYNWIRDGKLPVYRASLDKKNIRILETDLEKYLATREYVPKNLR